VRLTRSKKQEAGGKQPERSEAESKSAPHPSTAASLRSSSAQDVTDFVVFSGNYGAMLPGLTFGIVGAILAVANIAPNECVQVFDLFRQGKVEEAGNLHLRILPVARGVTSQFGVPGLKAAMNLLGYRGGWPRLPLLPLSANQQSEVEKMLREAALLK
jgi:4-hydroxy-2-oxoglutarate aldolase